MSQNIIQNIILGIIKITILITYLSIAGLPGEKKEILNNTENVIQEMWDDKELLDNYQMERRQKLFEKYKGKEKSDNGLMYYVELVQLEHGDELEQERINLKFTEYKYRKGIEIIQLIYEKILALDHHFTSLNTFQQINALSNPNSYPEFVQIKEKLKENSKKKSSIELPDLLDNNSLVSLSYSVISSLFGNGNRKEREKELEEISCLLDFTVSMHSELKIIFYETDFLKSSNLELKGSCSNLFKEYTRIVSYHTPLEKFRGGDDWDNLNRSVESIMNELHQNLETENPALIREVQRKVNNLEFSINRLLKFINTYDDFINQGEKYYQKFLTILENYNNRETCLSSLPEQYTNLESEVKNSILKFKSAYRIAELQGTKLRDLLYGVPQ